MCWLTRVISRPSKWEIVTSGGMSLSFGELIMAGGTLSALYLTQDSSTVQVSPFSMSGPVSRLWFMGAGLGIGVGTPIDLSVSSEDMPSGGAVYYGELTPKGKSLTLDDLTGPCAIRVNAAALLGGVSATIIGFGCPIGGPLMASKAIGILLGAGIETPGVSSMEYVGGLWRGQQGS
jgi:hypothetical protein